MAAIIGISATPKKSGSYTCTVPLDALEQDGVPPEQGDQVDYQISGTVQSVTDTDATVKIDSINGEPVTESAGEEAAEGEPPETPGEPGADGGGESTAAMGARLRKGAAGRAMPF